MVLHILNRSPFASRVHEDMLRAMVNEDRVLLIEDGVSAALKAGITLLPTIDERLYALKEDLEARGLSQRCDPCVNIVDVDGFVALTEQADKVVSWF
ncbi:sulfurtransferase complex subunit TusB [Phytohalomonas tamaricis]|uniref:sulfurtransferase complex subunit TusB n=1 Tax=Phytohalomonas tamaricis TaxID=2081032 RepID=UPI000D0B7202|nr:sulfurtransferase complex subunit TusB [Phytohalomonas tamaricis]